MPKYRRKEPATFEAFQYGLMTSPPGFIPLLLTDFGILVEAKRGPERALVGDWIAIRGDGLYEVYSPERFAELFEAAP